jgi:CheY-like chemotaxis protein
MTRSRTTSGGGTDSATVPTVLIVDDEPDQLGLLTEYFHRAGCTVVAAHDAEFVLALPDKLHLDILVVDLRLPGMDGWQLAERLRVRYPAAFLAITSVLDVDDYPVADAVLPKPVTKAHVQRLVDGVVSVKVCP